MKEGSKNTSLVAYGGDWTHTNESFVVLVDVFVERVSDPELGSALGVTEINQLFSTSYVQNIVEVSRNIILAHFNKGEIPELFVVSCVFDVFI